MSFLKKLAEKVTPPRVSVKLSLSESVLLVSSDEDFDAEEIRCEMQCVESAKVLKRFYDPGLKREVVREVWESATLHSARVSLSGPIRISKGFSEKFPFSILIPITLKPTSKSMDRNVSWTIKGVVAV
ncbi:MAG: hypothetical protein QXP74_04740, partial [Nitrososphaerota archaeon]